MAKPTKNQELAQYFTYAYMTEANNRFADGLDSLIDEFEQYNVKKRQKTAVFCEAVYVLDI